MHTIANGWASYAEQVLPTDAGPMQTQETKKAFYAGMCHGVNVMANVAMEMSEAEAMNVINNMCTEAEDFTNAIAKGGG